MTDHESEPPGTPLSEVPPKVATLPGCLWQFGGWAGASVICGLLSIAIPLDTTFTLPLVALAGLLMGVYAIWQGRVAGGIIGVALSLLGCLVGLLASFGGGGYI